jgi:hypothetical protein
MRKLVGVLGAAMLVAGLLVGLESAAGAAPAFGSTCTGTLAPGTYIRLTVPDGATCIGTGPITVVAGLTVGNGATFVLGSEEAPGNNGVINGGVRATNPANLQIHFMTINGGIVSHGGSGPFGPPFDVTFTTIEDSTINGGVTIDGYNGFWMGFIRNRVNGPVNLNNNVLVDPDANEYVTNRINGGLNCSGNDPAPQIGDSEGNRNIVNGPKTGQCANL